MAAGGEEVARHVPLTLTHVLYEEGASLTRSCMTLHCMWCVLMSLAVQATLWGTY